MGRSPPSLRGVVPVLRGALCIVCWPGSYPYCALISMEPLRAATTTTPSTFPGLLGQVACKLEVQPALERQPSLPFRASETRGLAFRARESEP